MVQMLKAKLTTKMFKELIFLKNVFILCVWYL